LNSFSWLYNTFLQLIQKIPCSWLRGIIFLVM